jgi:thioredoxin 1
MEYVQPEPSRAEVDRTRGTLVLDFGTNWCGYCLAAQPAITEALTGRDGVRHLKIEDGKGRPLGRSFGVKLWPTLVVLRDGVEVARVVRPGSADAVARAVGLAERA